MHGEAQLAGRWGDHGRQVVLDTCSVKVFLPGITDTTTLQAASTLCGQASWKIRGQDHATRHDVATPDMIRQLPAGFALVIRGGCAPVIARLPRAWKQPRLPPRPPPRPRPAPPASSLRPPAWIRTGHPRPRARRLTPATAPLPLELTMTTNDPITAILDQLAAHREQITQLDAREAATSTQPPLTEPDRPPPPRTATRTTDGYQPDPAPAAGGSSRPPTAHEPIARLRAWVEQVYRPGYGHLAATLGPCWEAHDLCLYGLDILPPCGRCCTSSPTAAPACCPPRPNTRPASCPPWPTSSGSRPPAAATPATPPSPGPGARHDRRHPPPGARLRRLRLAGLPLPARPEDPRHRARLPRRHHRPAADHRLVRPPPGLEPGHRHRRPRPRRPGRRPARPRRERLRRASPASATPGCSDGAAAYVRTPSGGLHAYFTGSAQHNGHLPGHHLDFRSAGGYVLAPPSQIGGQPYQLLSQPGGHGGLDWAAVTRLLQPQRQPPPAAAQPQAPGHDLGHLARWVAAQPEGNRNAGLFWAANRALDADPAADLSPLAAAARQAGLADPEITRTLDSARRTSQHPPPPARPPSRGRD